MNENPEFFIENGVLMKYQGPGGDVTVPAGVTEIRYEAFAECGSLTSVVLPEGVVEIGARAFEACENLRAVSFPESLRWISRSAFRLCRSLSRLRLPENLKGLGVDAFRDCRSLASVVLPAHFDCINGLAFHGCPRLADAEGFFIHEDALLVYFGPGGDLRVPEGVKQIAPAAFSDCEGLTAVTLPEGMESIYFSTFRNCKRLRSVSLPGTLRHIGDAAFQNCGSLRAVDLPNGLYSIGENAFSGCESLKAVSLPDSLVKVGKEAFLNCRSLAAVSLPGALRSLEDGVFQSCHSLQSVSLPAGLRSIGRLAFCRCLNLKALVFPEALERIEEAAFRSCRRLKSVSLPERLRSIGENAFRSCPNMWFVRLPTMLEELEAGAFADCKSLVAVSLPKGIEAVPERAFAGCESLKAVSLPKGLRSIGASAFRDCAALKAVSFPKSLRTIGSEAFRGCVGLKSVSLPGAACTIGRGAFRNCVSLRADTFPKHPKRPLIIDFGAFDECPGFADEQGFCILGGTLFRYLGAGGEVTVPEGVRRIDARALSGLPGTVRLTLPDSVTAVADDAFERSRLVIRVRRWFPDLTRAVCVCSLPAICTETDEGLPPWLRRLARFGPAFWPDAVIPAERARADAAWLSKNADLLVEDAFGQPELLHYLCDHRLIPPKDAPFFLEEAQARNSPELTALLLDYVNTLGPEVVEKARTRRLSLEAAAAAAREVRLAARRPEDGVSGLRIAADKDPAGWWSTNRFKRGLAEHGGRYQPKLSKNTDYLLSAAPSSPAARRAAAMGIPVITPDELAAMSNDPNWP